MAPKAIVKPREISHVLTYEQANRTIERFHVTSSKSNFYTIHSRKLLFSYFLEFHKLSLPRPKVWADMKFLSGVTDI